MPKISLFQKVNQLLPGHCSADLCSVSVFRFCLYWKERPDSTVGHYCLSPWQCQKPVRISWWHLWGSCYRFPLVCPGSSGSSVSQKAAESCCADKVQGFLAVKLCICTLVCQKVVVKTPETQKAFSNSILVFQSQQVAVFMLVLYTDNLKEAWRLNIIWAAPQSKLNLEVRRKPAYLRASGNRRGDISGWLIYLPIYFTINFGVKVSPWEKNGVGNKWSVVKNVW